MSKPRCGCIENPSTSIYGSPVAFPKARNGPRSGSRGSNQCLWCATSRNGSAFGRPIGITRPPAQEGQTGMRGHCCMSPARREAVFWTAVAAIGVATAETAAPDATSRRVKVPGLISGNESQFFCERAAVFAATATSKMRRGILLCGSQLMGLRAPKDWARHSPGVSLSHQGPQTTTDGRAARRWQHQRLACIDILATKLTRVFSQTTRNSQPRG